MFKTLLHVKTVLNIKNREAFLMFVIQKNSNECHNAGLLHASI